MKKQQAPYMGMLNYTLESDVCDFVMLKLFLLFWFLFFINKGLCGFSYFVVK